MSINFTDLVTLGKAKRMKRKSANDLTQEEIHAFTVPVTESGCWIWLRGTDKCGYGKTFVSGRHVGAHRASYKAFKGGIPDGLEILHSCDTPSCCNPDHLRLGTHKENSLDRVTRGRSARLTGSLNPSCRIDESMVRDIRAFEGSASSAARNFGISIASAWRIRTNKSWRNVA